MRPPVSWPICWSLLGVVLDERVTIVGLLEAHEVIRAPLVHLIVEQLEAFSIRVLRAPSAPNMVHSTGTPPIKIIRQNIELVPDWLSSGGARGCTYGCGHR